MSASGSLVQGRYRLVRQLREGADATAWEAVDVALDRPVEVRLLHPRLAADAAAAERFRRAARAAAQSVAPGRPRVLDAGDDAASGAPFMVTEPSSATAGDTAAGRPPAGFEATRPLAVVPPASRARPGRPPWQQPRDGGRSLAGVLLLAAVLLLAGGLVVGGVVFGARLLGRDAPVAAPSGSVAQATPGGPTPRPEPSATAVAAAATATRAPVRAAAASPSPLAGARRRVVNTDGRGVALRASPGGDRLPGKGYDEGAVVTLLGQSGEWAHIRGDDGREGWVLAVTLAP